MLRRLIQWCIACALTGCAAIPPTNLPADTAVMQSSGLWWRRPWAPAVPSFGEPRRDSAFVRSRFEVDDMVGTIAIVDSAGSPIRPSDDAWQRLPWQLFRCDTSTPRRACRARLAGTVFAGADGLVLHVRNQPWLDSVRQWQPRRLRLLGHGVSAGAVIDSFPIVYRR